MPTICQALVFTETGYVCVFGVREGGFFWGGKWSGLCVHRGIQSYPQSHRGSTTIPPRVLNYYHIYTFMWPLLCKICKNLLCIPFAYQTLGCYIFEKHSGKYCLENYPLYRSCTPLFHSSLMQEKFASLSFDPLYFFAACAFLNFWPLCLSHSQKPWGAVLKLKLLKRTVINVNIFSLERSNAAWERQISRYSHHRPWLLWSGLWMGFNSPSHWRSFDSHRDALTPGRREKGGFSRHCWSTPAWSLSCLCLGKCVCVVH